jgi:hypothetical protein
MNGLNGKEQDKPMLEWKRKSPDLLKNQHVEVEGGWSVPKQRIRHRIELELRSFGRKGMAYLRTRGAGRKSAPRPGYASTFGKPVAKWLPGHGSQEKLGVFSDIVTLAGDMRLTNGTPTRLGLLGAPDAYRGAKMLTQRSSGTAILAKLIFFTRRFCTSTSRSPGEDIASTLGSGWIRKTATTSGENSCPACSVRPSKFSSFRWLRIAGCRGFVPIPPWRQL